MLLALTPNPALDKTLIVPAFRVADVCRVREVQDAAGGKGLNVARVAQTLGSRVRVAAPLGGPTGERVAALAKQEGLDACWHWLASGETRTCLLVTDPDMPDTLTLNEHGPVVTKEDWMHFSNLVLQQAAGASFISCSGSLPPGVEPAWLVDVLHDLLGMGVSLILDTSGAALAASLALPLAVLKVNSQELGEALGISIRSPQDAYEVAARVITSGPQNCIVTLGSVGAVLASPHGGWYVRPPTVRAVSAVGSGDAVLAGVASALLRGQSIVSALNLGIACGTANTLTVGAGNVHLADVDALSRATVLERLA